MPVDTELAAIRDRVISVAEEMYDAGLTQQTFGNVSARLQSARENFVITPSSVPYESISREQLPLVTVDGEIEAGTGRPSTETVIHRHLYDERDDIDAIVHTHSPFATTFAALGDDIRPYHNSIAHAGGTIHVTEYANNGTEELAREVVAEMDGKRAVLMRNHGVLAGGESLEDALYVSSIVEFCARVQYQAQLLGEPEPVDDSDLAYLSEHYHRQLSDRTQPID